MIYWDNNSTTPCAPEVLEAMRPYWSEEFGNPSSPHAMGRKAEGAVKKAREQVADLINALPEEVVFTSGATESNNLLFLGVLLSPKTERRTIVISSIEHKSVLEPALLLQEHGFEVVQLPVDRTGLVDIESAKNIVNANTLLVSVHAANNELGTIQPIAELACLAHANGAYFHTDAAQALGKIPFDVETINCDFASFSSHKIYGPKGVGALFIRGGARRWPWARPFRGGGQESDLRPGTSNVTGIVGLGAACLLSKKYIQMDYLKSLSDLEKYLIKHVLTLHADCIFHAADAIRIPGVISVAFQSIPADLLINNLKSLALSNGSACSSFSITISHVLEAIGCERCAAKETVRISLGRETTKNDIDNALNALACSMYEIKRTLKNQ